jgi:type VII secretion-associated serine protease mycosin
MLSYPSVWRLTEGGGETVALIDSGVDANPQLNGRVVVGQTLANAPSGPANGDCVGHGTLAAGLIAASSENGGMGGMAPQATIYSEKVTNSESVNVDTLATAINDAVAAHVRVISMSVASAQGDGNLAAAVQNALSNNIVVVAAAGNDTLNQKGQVTKAGPFYPASYPGVLSVGAVDDTGALADFSDQKSQVGVTAPGVDVTSTYPGANGDSYAADAGTSFATPLVAGLAALVRARYPQLSAAQVVQRIEETADGNEGPGTGYGLINPVQALTAVIPATGKSQSAAVTINRPATNGTQKEITLALTGGAVAIVAIVLAAAVVIPAGRRRRWRPGGLS